MERKKKKNEMSPLNSNSYALCTGVVLARFTYSAVDIALAAITAPNQRSL